MSVAPRPGFFGKLPSHGDFVTRGLSRDFTEGWDQWLQHCVAASKATLGAEWTDIYLVSPIWRFVLSADVCGSSAWAGIVFPSVDRVGRYFPLTIAVATLPGALPLQIVTSSGAWYAAAEQLAWEVLEEEGYDADRLEQAVAALGGIEFGAARLSFDAQPPAAGVENGVAVAIAAGATVGQTVLVLAQQLIAATMPGGHSLWWTGGSEQVPPMLFVSPGLPDPGSYAGLLDFDHAAGAAAVPIGFGLPDAVSTPGAADEGAEAE